MNDTTWGRTRPNTISHSWQSFRSFVLLFRRWDLHPQVLACSFELTILETVAWTFRLTQALQQVRPLGLGQQHFVTRVRPHSPLLVWPIIGGSFMEVFTGGSQIER
jgi:hypothetical protein